MAKCQLLATNVMSQKLISLQTQVLDYCIVVLLFVGDVHQLLALFDVSHLKVFEGQSVKLDGL